MENISSKEPAITAKVTEMYAIQKLFSGVLIAQKKKTLSVVDTHEQEEAGSGHEFVMRDMFNDEQVSPTVAALMNKSFLDATDKAICMQMEEAGSAKMMKPLQSLTLGKYITHPKKHEEIREYLLELMTYATHFSLCSEKQLNDFADKCNKAADQQTLKNLKFQLLGRVISHLKTRNILSNQK